MFLGVPSGAENTVISSEVLHTGDRYRTRKSKDRKSQKGDKMSTLIIVLC